VVVVLTTGARNANLIDVPWVEACWPSNVTVQSRGTEEVPVTVKVAPPVTCWELTEAGQLGSG
jgi:hypothetical protein